MAEVVTENTGDSNTDKKDTAVASEIPFYPDYRYERSLDNTLNVYWFEKDFCQHNYGQYAHRNSNACTIIGNYITTHTHKHTQKIENFCSI